MAKARVRITAAAGIAALAACLWAGTGPVLAENPMDASSMRELLEKQRQRIETLESEKRGMLDELGRLQSENRELKEVLDRVRSQVGSGEIGPA